MLLCYAKYLQNEHAFNLYFQQITKNQVNNFDPGCKQPFYCQLHVEWTKEEEQPMELLHRVNLLGARTPFNFFVIQLPQLHLQPIGSIMSSNF